MRLYTYFTFKSNRNINKTVKKKTVYNRWFFTIFFHLRRPIFTLLEFFSGMTEKPLNFTR